MTEFVTVPRKPTEAMIWAGACAEIPPGMTIGNSADTIHPSAGSSGAKAIYAAMLDAAPLSSAPEGEREHAAAHRIAATMGVKFVPHDQSTTPVAQANGDREDALAALPAEQTFAGMPVGDLARAGVLGWHPGDEA